MNPALHSLTDSVEGFIAGISVFFTVGDTFYQTDSVMEAEIFKKK